MTKFNIPRSGILGKSQAYPGPYITRRAVSSAIRLILLGGAVSLTLATPRHAAAQAITYTEQGTGSGVLNGTPFTGQEVIFTLNSNASSAGVSGLPAELRNSAISGTVFVNGIGTVSLNLASVGGTPLSTWTNQSNLGGMFETLAENDLLDTSSTSWSTYHLETNFGPIPGPAVGNRLLTIETVGGTFDFTTVPTTSIFTATLGASPTPEPGSYALLVSCGLGAAGVFARSRRRK